PRSLFFTDRPTSAFYTLSLHDALPISGCGRNEDSGMIGILRESPHHVTAGQMHLLSLPAFDDNYIWLLRDAAGRALVVDPGDAGDRKSTRLNSSHVKISYAVFCLKKKK